jgi:hypothetical protein
MAEDGHIFVYFTISIYILGSICIYYYILFSIGADQVGNQNKPVELGAWRVARL